MSITFSRFTLRGMLVFSSILIVLFNANIRATVTSEPLFLSIFQPPNHSSGENPNLRDRLKAERGFPCRYQQVTKLVPEGAGAELSLKGGQVRTTQSLTSIGWYWTSCLLLCWRPLPAVWCRLVPQ